MEKGLNVSKWLEFFESLQKPLMDQLVCIYGEYSEVREARAQLWRKALLSYHQWFGNGVVRLFRAPARINLRGMHVDTHGGYLNLLTHQRETVVVAGLHDSLVATLKNCQGIYNEVIVNIPKLSEFVLSCTSWEEVLQKRSRFLGESPQENHNWARYLYGVFARVIFELKKLPQYGVQIAVASDIPIGAGLSSSHALCTAMLVCLSAIWHVEMSDEKKILAIRDAEWYAGARSGVSDQGAMILCKKGELVNVPLFVKDLNLSELRRTSLPDSIKILVVNSFTTRNLSGEHFEAYTKNRFAYSLALEVVRNEMSQLGLPDEFVNGIDRFARLSTEYLKPYGGEKLIYHLLNRVPEKITLENLIRRYQLKDVDVLIKRYFGDLPESKYPKEIQLRGPLLFGIAESERARKFFDYIRAGDVETAGRLMNIGHDGDRLYKNGKPFISRVDNEILTKNFERNVPIEFLPGAYGASSYALDLLVDKALEFGAWGASLTGAGIAGSIIVLCTQEQKEIIKEKLSKFLISDEYTQFLSEQGRTMSEKEFAEGVLVNYPIAGAGELTLEVM